MAAEFFVAPERVDALLARLIAALPSASYVAANARGETRTNAEAGAVNAVTWGVFPGAPRAARRAPPLCCLCRKVVACLPLLLPILPLCLPIGAHRAPKSTLG